MLLQFDFFFLECNYSLITVLQYTLLQLIIFLNNFLSVFSVFNLLPIFIRVIMSLVFFVLVGRWDNMHTICLVPSTCTYSGPADAYRVCFSW